MNTKGRRWTFTLNNPNETETHAWVTSQLSEGKGFKYLVFQKETGENGTPHYQGFVIFDGHRRFVAVRRALPRAHWELARGSSPQNRHYCSKPIDGCSCSHCGSASRLEGPWEQGVCPEGAGDRAELKRVKELIQSGKRKRDLLDDDDGIKVMAKFPRFVDTCYAHFRPEDPQDKQVTLLYGPSGCGKTSFVRRSESDLWFDSIGTKGWFDGYDNHEAALLDDFGGELSLGIFFILRRNLIYQA